MPVDSQKAAAQIIKPPEPQIKIAAAMVATAKGYRNGLRWDGFHRIVEPFISATASRKTFRAPTYLLRRIE